MSSFFCAEHKLLFFVVKDTSVKTFEKNSTVLLIPFVNVRWAHVHNSQNLIIATISYMPKTLLHTLQ